MPLTMNTNFISVMLPTRSRTHLVEPSIISILDLADDPSRIQIAVAYDDDDAESHAYFNSDQWKTLVESRGGTQVVFETKDIGGYDTLHDYYNYLADNTSSEWLLIWNDDAIMETQGWDTEVWNNRDWHGMLNMECNSKFDHDRPDQALFPAIPRTWHTMFGTLADDVIDVWIGDICREVDAIKIISSEIFHDHAAVTGNNNDEIFKLNWTKEKRRANKRRYRSQEAVDTRHNWASQWAAARPVGSSWVPRTDEQKDFDNEQARFRALRKADKVISTP